MFSLIISIIAIALVAALAGASVYYGGSAFNKGTAGADASTLINGGQQVNGAVALAKADAVTVEADITVLEPAYLTQIPSFKGASFALDNTTATTGGVKTYAVLSDAAVTADICAEVVSRGGVSGALAADTDALFGCEDDAAFYYRVN